MFEDEGIAGIEEFEERVEERVEEMSEVSEEAFDEAMEEATLRTDSNLFPPSIGDSHSTWKATAIFVCDTPVAAATVAVVVPAAARRAVGCADADAGGGGERGR